MKQVRDVLGNYIRIGDIVKVVDRGKLYTSYQTMYKIMGFKKPMSDHNYPFSFDDNINWKIFAIEPHTKRSATKCLGLENPEDGYQILIGRKGVELIQSKKLYKLW